MRDVVTGRTEAWAVHPEATMVRVKSGSRSVAHYIVREGHEAPTGETRLPVGDLALRAFGVFRVGFGMEK